MQHALKQVDTSRGAPMGRNGKDLQGNLGPIKMHLEHVTLDSGGYDKGGAYWGLRFPQWRKVACRPIGHPADAPPVMRNIKQTAKIYRYYWGSNRNPNAPILIEGFIDAWDREDAKAQVLAKYPQATFYK